jgi:hypothetical protein
MERFCGAMVSQAQVRRLFPARHNRRSGFAAGNQAFAAEKDGNAPAFTTFARIILVAANMCASADI